MVVTPFAEQTNQKLFTYTAENKEKHARNGTSLKRKAQF